MQGLLRRSAILARGVVLATAMSTVLYGGEPSVGPRRADLTDYRACGPTCLYLIFQMLGVDTAFDEVKKSVDPDGDEQTSLAELATLARQKGLAAMAAKLTTDELGSVPGPAILHMRSAEAKDGGEGDHFMIYLGQSHSGEIVVLDAPRSPSRESRQAFDRAWTGNVLILGRSEAELAALSEAIDGQRGRASLGVLLLMIPILAGVAIRLWWKPFLAEWARFITRASTSCRCARPIILLLSTMIAGGCGSKGTPEFVVDEIVPFGVVSLQDHEAHLRFRNAGTAPLRLFSVGAQCNCTVTTGTETTAPGAEGEITVKLRAVAPGPGSSRLSVTSNDPRSPHEVYVRWFGEHPPTLSPTAISRDDLPRDTKFQQTVRIIYAGGDPDQPITVKVAESSNPAISLKQSDALVTARYDRYHDHMNSIGVAGEIDYLVTCQLPLSGELSGECRFEIEQAGRTDTLALPVRLKVGPLLSASPASLYYSSRRDSADLVGLKKQIVLTVCGGEQPTLLSAPDFLKCTIRESGLQAGGERRAIYFLIAEVMRPVPLADGAPVGHVELSVGEGKDARLNLPVHVRVLP